MDWIQIISTLGFPIACVIALGYFVWVFTNKIMTENKEREAEYVKMMTRTNDLLSDCQETNKRFVAQLESMQGNFEQMKEDVDDIKNILNINNRKND